jgi:hypothetical protein
VLVRCIHVGDTRAHSSAATVGLIDYHSGTDTIISADDCGRICVWRMGNKCPAKTHSEPQSASLFGLFASLALSPAARIETLAVSAEGSLIGVSVSRRMLLLCLDGNGSLYVRAELDTEPAWSVRTAYLSVFDDGFIRLWKCSTNSRAPNEFQLTYWSHPCSEQFLYREKCNFRYFQNTHT